MLNIVLRQLFDNSNEITENEKMERLYDLF